MHGDCAGADVIKCNCATRAREAAPKDEHYDIVACNAASTRPATRHACGVCLRGFALHVKRLRTIAQERILRSEPDLENAARRFFSAERLYDTIRRRFSAIREYAGEFQRLSRT